MVLTLLALPSRFGLGSSLHFVEVIQNFIVVTINTLVVIIAHKLAVVGMVAIDKVAIDKAAISNFDLSFNSLVSFITIAFFNGSSVTLKKYY